MYSNYDLTVTMMEHWTPQATNTYLMGITAIRNEKSGEKMRQAKEKNKIA